MNEHEICAVCKKSCKQQPSEWDWSNPIKKFCPMFSPPDSQLSYNLLMSLQKFVKGCETSEDEHTWNSKTKIHLAFLKALESLYVPCYKCNRWIAPDEVFTIIGDENAVCSRCSE